MVQAMLILWLIAALLIKHFVADFLLQFPSMLESKGRYLARGGVDHAFVHGILTGLIFWAFGFHGIAAALGVLDILIHYHVDYLKSKVNTWMRLDPSKDRFWTAMGADQLAHGLTYVLLVALALNK